MQDDRVIIGVRETIEDGGLKIVNVLRERAMAKGDDIQEKLVHLAVQLVRICEKLPETKTAGHIASQLLRSGTSPAPNYAEARGAESDKDFVHKLKVVLKELNECLVWLSIIQGADLLGEEQIRAAREECTALCRITAASIKTVKARCAIESKSPGFGRG
jgi:four helix bundle protein